MGDAIIGIFENQMLLNGFIMLGVFFIAMRAEASPPKPTDEPGSANRKGFWRLLKWVSLVVGSGSLLAGLFEIM